MRAKKTSAFLYYNFYLYFYEISIYVFWHSAIISLPIYDISFLLCEHSQI